MSVRFILGRAGSGKTRLCRTEVLEEIRRAPDGPPLILLVPDQATYQVERALLGAVDGFVRVCPYSFARLSHRILGEVGGAGLPVLDEVGKRMFLTAVIRDVRSDLQVYHKSWPRVGFTESVAKCIAEFHWYAKTPEDVRTEAERRRAQDGRASSLSLKLLDLARIYEVFEERIRDRFLDGDATLALLARRLPESSWIRGARVWVDGFSGFTPQEYAVLASLARTVDTLSIALCLDPGRVPKRMSDLNPLSPFHPSEETYLKLADMPSVTIDDRRTIRLPAVGQKATRFTGRPALGALETALFSRRPRPYPGRPARIRLLEAPDRRAEVRAVARDILRRAREDGTRYREMAVLVRDLEPYADLVRSVFSEYGIPFFLDERRSVAHHPLVELVRSAVRAAATGWPTDVVLQYLKTDLVHAGRDPRETSDRTPIDDVENYALAFGVRGAAWREEAPWSNRALGPEDGDASRAEEQAALDRVDATRRSALAELVEFNRRVHGESPTVCDVVKAIYALLTDLNVRERLEAWAEKARENGRPAEADEHATVWKNVVGLLDSLETSLGETRLSSGHDPVQGETDLSLHDVLDILEAGLERLRLGLIPPTLDQVTVGSVERSRHPDLKAAYVLGVGDGAFPRPRAEDPILSDRDRDRLHEGAFDLAPSARRELHKERYFAYIAFTRARDALWVSYPRADEEGAELLPSAFLTRFKGLFQDLAVETLERDTGPSSPADIVRIEDLAEAVNRGARDMKPGTEDPWWFQALGSLLDLPGVRDMLERTASALIYRNRAALDPAAAGALYGATLRSGVVALEGFAECPFRYFAGHGLKLRERPTYELGPPDLGLLYHEVLSRFFERTRAAGHRWADLMRRRRGRSCGRNSSKPCRRSKRTCFDRTSGTSRSWKKQSGHSRRTRTLFFSMHGGRRSRPWLQRRRSATRPTWIWERDGGSRSGDASTAWTRSRGRPRSLCASSITNRRSARWTSGR